MTPRTVAVFHYLWPAEGLKRPPGRRLAAQYAYAVWYKANPRSEDYMRALMAERFPGAEWVRSDDPGLKSRVADADRVVLLYPDSIGLGFMPIERLVLSHKSPLADVVVLNGRRREFRLNTATRLGLRLRRLLEWTMLPEMLMLPIFIIATPVLWTVDAVRGRR